MSEVTQRLNAYELRCGVTVTRISEFSQPIELSVADVYRVLNAMLHSVGLNMATRFADEYDYKYLNNGPFRFVLAPEQPDREPATKQHREYLASMVVLHDNGDRTRHGERGARPLLMFLFAMGGIWIRRFDYLFLSPGLQPSRCARALQARMTEAARYELYGHDHVTWVI